MTNNGLNGSSGATLFRYVRPTFDGYGFGDQPDKRVRQQLDVVVKELAKGFHDIDTRQNQAQYEALKGHQTYLEDEEENGNGEPIQSTSAKAAATTGKSSQKDIDTNIDQVREKPVQAKTDSIDAMTSFNTKLDLEEAKRKIQIEETPPGADEYINVFDLTRFMADKVQAGRIRFQNKIGGNPKLHGLYVVVEDRLQRARLPFNASLFFAEEDLLRFVFLRAFYVDGLRDADAIAERVMDADEGGTKHIYDYIVAQMVRRDLRDRKLI